jgi:hypothetical protein
VEIPCVQCKTALPLHATFCNACGRPVDADKDGVPDAIGNLVEQKARAIVAEQRAADQAAEEAKRRSELVTKLTAEQSAAELALEQNKRLPRSVFRAFTHLWGFYAVLIVIVWLIFGSLFHLFLFGAIGYSPAGVVLCSTHCEGCEAPGRVFSWNFKGSWKEKKGQMGYALVCHNDKLNVDKLDWTQVRNDPMNTTLQPYMIDGVWSYFVEGFVLAPTLGFVLAVTRAASRRRQWARDRVELERKLAALRAQRASLSGDPVPEVGTFRG